MGQFSTGRKVKLRSGKTATIVRPLESERYQVQLNDDAGNPTTVKMGVSTWDIVKAIQPTPIEFFNGQRMKVYNLLQSANPQNNIEAFEKAFNVRQKKMFNIPGVNLKKGSIYCKPINESSKIVFSCLNSVPEPIYNKLLRNGLNSVKYSKKEYENKSTDEIKGGFLQSIPHDKENNIECHALLTAVNTHKAGDTSTSGFQSATTDPEYAASFSDGFPEKKDVLFYNIGLAIEITDKCYPLAVCQTFDEWNAFCREQRSGKGQLQMARSSTYDDVGDVESEILLGGAIGADEIVYLTSCKLTRSEVTDWRKDNDGLKAAMKEKFGKFNAALDAALADKDSNNDNNNNNNNNNNNSTRSTTATTTTTTGK